MNLLITSQGIETVQADAVIFFAGEEYVAEVGSRGPSSHADKVLVQVAGTDFKGENGQSIVLYSKDIAASRMIFVGLGKQKDMTLERIRKAAHLGLQRVKSLNLETFGISVPTIEGIPDSDISVAMTETLVLGNYSFNKYKTEDKEKRKEVKDAILVYPFGDMIDDVQGDVAAAEIIANNTNFVRDLVNENSDVMHSVRIAEIAETIANKYNLKRKILAENDIKAEGLGLLHAVGKGAAHPPRLILMEYDGDPTSNEKIAVVGKGITYDSGGLNLKPTGYCETMKSDMAGAATVLGIIRTAAELKLRKNLIAVIPTCENSIGPNAYKPGDVVTSYSGKTVFIGNTDAEGRLVLADGISYVIKNLKPTKIIDLATLTGAVRVALGDYIAGLITNDDAMAKGLSDAGEKTYERVWRLPLFEEQKEDIKNDVADLANMSKEDRAAGTIAGAAFLEEFTEGLPWAHLDIAATAFYDKPRGIQPKGATGFGVRLVAEFLRNN